MVAFITSDAIFAPCLLPDSMVGTRRSSLGLEADKAHNYMPFGEISLAVSEVLLGSSDIYV